MKVSKLFGKTLKEAPSEAEIDSHRLLVRAGMIRQIAAGVYSMLPLGWRTFKKIEGIIREEMDKAGGQELAMPILQPVELWEETGRHLSFGQTLFKVTDRKDRLLILGPTHEEVITDLVRHYVKSYRDLPLLLYQIQTKLRDEPRSRGGLLRVREFFMKDLYSFDMDEAGLEISYRKMKEAYTNIYKRCGLSAVMVEADSGVIGGKESHEFMLLASSGEDEIIYCKHCGYSANVEKAQSARKKGNSSPYLSLEEVATPGRKTIQEVAEYLGVPASETLKAVFYSSDEEVVLVIIRGDLDVNEIKLKNALKSVELRLAREDEVKACGIVTGYASPVGIKGIKIAADDSITLGTNYVAGANREGFHLKNVNYPRDFKADLLLDIARAKGGDICPHCGEVLFSSRGIEVGHIFKLGTYISAKMGANFLDKDGTSRTIIMGCYGIGLGRVMAAAVEQNHDEKGITWPAPIAPYHIYICGLSLDNTEVLVQAEEIYGRLLKEGLEVLYDDRIESAGVKFNDADLLGMPLRLTVSPRTLQKKSVEVKLRRAKDTSLYPIEGIEKTLRDILSTMS